MASPAGTCGGPSQVAQIIQTFGGQSEHLTLSPVRLHNPKLCVRLGKSWQQAARVEALAQMGIGSPGQTALPAPAYHQQLNQLSGLISQHWHLVHGPVQYGAAVVFGMQHQPGWYYTLGCVWQGNALVMQDGQRPMGIVGGRQYERIAVLFNGRGVHPLAQTAQPFTASQDHDGCRGLPPVAGPAHH
jgi:hypothetical protein